MARDGFEFFHRQSKQAARPEMQKAGTVGNADIGENRTKQE